MAASQVLQILRDIEADTFRNAAPLPHKRDTRPEWQGIGFQLGGVRLVSPLGEVGEILKLPRVTALPRVRDWVAGRRERARPADSGGRPAPLLRRHGDRAATAVAVADRRCRRDQRGTRSSSSRSACSIFRRTASRAVILKVLDAIHPFIKGAYRHGGRVFYVVSLAALVRDERFLNVAE